MVKSTLSPARACFQEQTFNLLAGYPCIQSCKSIEHIQASMMKGDFAPPYHTTLRAHYKATAQSWLGVLAHPRSDRQRCHSTSPCRRRRTRARPWAYGCRNRPPGGPGTAAAPPIRQISSHSINCGLQRHQGQPYAQPSLSPCTGRHTHFSAGMHTYLRPHKN